MNQKIYVGNEIDPLQSVIIHRPDAGIARITPKRSSELLFDDIVHLPLMQQEHDQFKKVLQLFTGRENVHEVENLLYEALVADTTEKRKLLEWVVQHEELPVSTLDFLQALPEAELRDILITGYHAPTDHIFFDPIPNYIFTRDIAVTVGKYVVITKAAKEARHRENYLTRFLFGAHPYFQTLREQGRIINLNLLEHFPPSRQGEHVHIEGGDVMMIHPDYLLIGCSERSNPFGITSLRDILFQKDAVSQVVKVNIPKERSYMHIDTLFTQIGRHDVIAYKPLIEEGGGIAVTVYRKNGETANYNGLASFWRAELDPEVRFLFAGDGISPYQEREQWTDGCNLLALKPGVALAYDRNPRTEKALIAAGYRILSAADLLRETDTEEIRQMENTIITIPSSELSRARGGSHCMSCPIHRMN